MAGLFSLGMYVPWASGKSALVSAVASLIFILWVAICGNVSRVTGLHSAPKLPVSDVREITVVTKGLYRGAEF